MTPEHFAALCGILGITDAPPVVTLFAGRFYEIVVTAAPTWVEPFTLTALGTSEAECRADYQRQVLLAVARRRDVLDNRVALSRAFALAGDAALAALDAEFPSTP